RAGARTASETLAIAVRSRSSDEIVQSDPLDRLLRARFPRPLSASRFARHLLVLHRRHLDEVPHLLELAGQAGRHLLHHDVLVMLEANGLERQPHAPRMADPAPNLLDAYGALGREFLLGRFLGTLARVPDECTRHATRPP